MQPAPEGGPQGGLSRFGAIALDPGGTTGITLAKKMGHELHLEPTQERMTPNQLLLYLGNALTMNPDLLVICESFEFRQRARAGLDLTPAHLIGVVMAVTPVRQLYMQTAAEGKGHFSDYKLKQLGIYIKGRPHAMDSLRHFMQWFTYGSGYQYNDNPELILHGLPD